MVPWFRKAGYLQPYSIAPQWPNVTQIHLCCVVKYPNAKERHRRTRQIVAEKDFAFIGIDLIFCFDFMF